ncbi:hypothetical protein EYZ11_004550 [Aspergillus tanneri]|uniref:BTB domain-containing protein n=1 Tax=Aspergillus tanneri TaxID=1220188 RepID=A0A4S3JKF9_9EURO|nr:hypothetical protein EYZ11_004550 [Aspergillus tanneri]
MSSENSSEIFVESDLIAVAVTAILEHGDVILEYISPDHLSESAKPYIYRWQVSSEALAQNSPYFKALLDPNKFSEGRLFMKQKTEHRGTATDIDDDASNHPHPDSDGESVWKDLPTVRLPSGHISPKLGVDAIGTFLRILSFGSFDEEKQRIFDLEIKFQRPSLVARVVQLADAFNSPHVVREALQRSAYVYGRKHSFLKFDDSMLKLAEDRIRQSIFIARFLDDRTVFQILTHTLIILGSKSWIMGLEQLISPPAFPWWYLPDGLEDLQAYFLRAFGALEEPETEPATPKGPGRAITSSRPYQCRCGYGNSSACDMFHLGQMTRFFALRTKTIFLGSSLIDPEFDLEILSDGVGNVSDRAQAQAQTQSVGNGELPPSTDITAVIASLRQCPDYQIDTNHTGCGWVIGED